MAFKPFDPNAQLTAGTDPASPAPPAQAPPPPTGGAALPPGIGNSQQAMQATAFMRQQPWYQQQLKQWGYDPASVDTNGNLNGRQFSDQQQDALLNLARDKGIGISDNYHVDQNGQIAQNDSHWLRNLGIAGAIAGSMFIPGVGPAVLSGLGHIGSALGSGLSSAGHGLSSAFGFGGAGGGGAAGGAAGGSGLGEGAGFGSWAMGAPTEASLAADAAVPGLASTTIGSGFMPAITGGTGIPGLTAGLEGAAGATGAASKGAGSVMNRLFKNGPKDLANMGSLLGSFSQGEKANRVVGANMMDQYNRQMLQAQQDRDRVETDALKKLGITSYLTNGHGGYQAPDLTLADGTHQKLNDYGFGYTAPSAAQIQGATDLQKQLTERLKPGGTYTPMKPQIDPGTAENIGSYGGTGLGIAGGIWNMFRPESQEPDYSNIGKSFMDYFRK